MLLEKFDAFLKNLQTDFLCNLPLTRIPEWLNHAGWRKGLLVRACGIMCAIFLSPGLGETMVPWIFFGLMHLSGNNLKTWNGTPKMCCSVIWWCHWCGTERGVQSRFRDKHLEAIHVHCYAREFNLVLCAKFLKRSQRHIFKPLECLYSFFSTPPVHYQKLQEIQRTLEVGEKRLVP